MAAADRIIVASGHEGDRPMYEACVIKGRFCPIFGSEKSKYIEESRVFYDPLLKGLAEKIVTRGVKIHEGTKIQSAVASLNFQKKGFRKNPVSLELLEEFERAYKDEVKRKVD